MKNFQIRCMSFEQLELALQWAEQEGWQPGIHDAAYYYSSDPQGFFMGFLDNEPIGCISGVAYDNSYGFIGLYIVRPAFRGQGFGIALWNTAMQHLQGRNIGLDGVIAQQSNYQKSGFKIAYRHLRFQALGTGVMNNNAVIISLSELAFAQVLAYDLFPVARPVFLQSWLKQTQGAALGIMDKEQLVGYGVIRACQQSFRIGPLFADSLELADSLFTALLAHAPANSPVFIDVPEINPTALLLIKRHALPLVFETARMYTQATPAIDTSKIYGVTTLELG